ncbi:hypothetical protein ACFLU0_00395 [Chloroflexota bacterium]
MVEIFRDKTRDDLAQDLNTCGVRADLAERSRVEEQMEKSRYKFQRSLGVIDIPEGPIRWINLVKRDRSRNSPPRWWVVFGIPDERPNSKYQAVRIKTVRKKTFPLFGKVVDVRWKGKDYSTGLIDVLSNDEVVKNLATRIGNLTVRSYVKEFQGWTLLVDRRIKPVKQDWEALQKIAGYILSSPRLY